MLDDQPQDLNAKHYDGYAVAKLERPTALSEHFIGFLQRANLDAGSPEPRIAQERRRKDAADKELERKLEQAGEALEWAKAEAERLKGGVERVKGEREFYHERVRTLEQDNHKLTEAATKYSLWGQKLERELAKLDPEGVPARRFGAGHDA